ncbi:MAG: LutB/LldF family L-lactate oxidation iron-sulfur protein [Candidatus Methylacidiphilales bacterium]|nr:LutB/LldF family L-lactate oxidation iron-sulfur protein [Candidatus Methylacidiphilales bacterium]
MSLFSTIFHKDADVAAHDDDRRGFIRRALKGYEVLRDQRRARFKDYNEARQAAAEIKYDAINHLDTYLAEFCRKAEARGTKTYFASTSAHARDYILHVARTRNVRSIIKSKSMTSEEIHLNDALEHAGFGVVESDLGEYIIQLNHEPPYHFVFPCMHLKRDEISRIFEKALGSAKTDSPEELTMIARRALRQEYLKADMGISGANFIVAETGMISITENEGNARLSVGVPRIHIALVGIEKVLPKLEDLALFLPMLATAGTGQALTCYNSMYGGPRQPGEIDGPEEFHVVFLDNHRTRLLADPEQRDALHCIRCGACLNVCPIFKNVGGHTYGTTYQGPIGSVITPHMRGLQDWKHLSSASSLCGACTEACPVKIDLHHHLLHNRRNAMQEKPVWWEKLAIAGFNFVMGKPWVYKVAMKLAPLAQHFHPAIECGPFDPVISWTETRTCPQVATTTFKDWWRERKEKKPKQSQTLHS